MQWDARGGLQMRHVEHHLSGIVTPRTCGEVWRSFREVQRERRQGAWPTRPRLHKPLRGRVGERLGVVDVGRTRQDARVRGCGRHEQRQRQRIQQHPDARHERRARQRRADKDPKGDAEHGRQRDSKAGDAPVRSNHDAAVAEKGVPAAPGLPAFEARLRGHGRRYRLSVHAVSCSGSSGGGGERCVSGSVRCVFGACVCAVGWRDWPTRLQNGVQESR